MLLGLGREVLGVVDGHGGDPVGGEVVDAGRDQPLVGVVGGDAVVHVVASKTRQLELTNETTSSSDFSESARVTGCP